MCSTGILQIDETWKEWKMLSKTHCATELIWNLFYSLEGITFFLHEYRSFYDF